MELCISQIVFDFFLLSLGRWTLHVHMDFCFELKAFLLCGVRKKNGQQKTVLRVMRLCERNRTEPGDRNKAGEAKNTKKGKYELISSQSEI